MNARRITEFTFETTESITIRRGATSTNLPCTDCGSVEGMVTLDEACALFNGDLRDLCREIESGRVHLSQAGPGSFLICFHSLKNTAQLILSSSNPQLNPKKENPS